MSSRFDFATKITRFDESGLLCGEFCSARTGNPEQQICIVDRRRPLRQEEHSTE